jgi:glutamyl-tRNA reductase
MVGVPLVVGVNHLSAPVELRERLALGEDQLSGVLGSLRGSFQAAILSTCNRIELYTVSSGEDSLHGLRRFFGSWGDTSPDELSPYIYAHAGPEAVRHLFRVAAGLDSMVVGEAQILGQVADASRKAETAGSGGRELDRLFSHAIRVGRRVREETAIGRNGASIPGVAVGLARQVLGSLKGRRVLIVGAGKAGLLSARALLGSGAAEAFVSNRTDQRSRELAADIGGTVIPFSSLGDVLPQVDVVVSGTGASEPVISFKDIERAMERRANTSLLLVDIAVPRDIEPSVAGIPGVHLYNIDRLHGVAKSNLHQRCSEVEKVERIVEEAVGNFVTWWRSLPVLPTIKEIQQAAEDVRERELARALRDLSHLGPEERQTVEMMSRAIVKKLLHHPFRSLKDTPEDEEYVATARRLFNLPERNGGSSPRTGP